MENKDKLGIEIKSIMEEETFDLTLSQKALDNIIQHSKKSLKTKIREFLNREIEIPVAPAIIGFAALLAVTLIPGDLFKSQDIKIIDMGGSYVIIREGYEVSRK
jgi:hypothetical protein